VIVVCLCWRCSCHSSACCWLMAVASTSASTSFCASSSGSLVCRITSSLCIYPVFECLRSTAASYDVGGWVLQQQQQRSTNRQVPHQLGIPRVLIRYQPHLDCFCVMLQVFCMPAGSCASMPATTRLASLWFTNKQPRD
jgi:hypothetical protein